MGRLPIPILAIVLLMVIGVSLYFGLGLNPDEPRWVKKPFAITPVSR